MKRLLLITSFIFAGAVFAGCQSTSAPTAQAPTNTPVKQTVEPVKTTTTATSDADEVKQIDNDLKQLDATKDFPDFSQADLQ